MEFRRRLDYQGSAELIPTAGPDAAADQGPAIKAVWEPQSAGALPGGPGTRRADRRQPARAGQAGERARATGARRRKKRTAVVGGAAVAAVAVGTIGFMSLSGGGDPLVRGAATKVLPAASVTDATPTGESASSNIGGSLSITGRPSRSATPSHSPAATATQSKGPAKSPGATPSGAASLSPSPSPTPHKTTCFLFICG